VPYVPTLIESKRPLASRGAVEGGMISFVLHTALVAAAVYATMMATRAVVEGRLIVDVALPRDQAAPPPPPERPLFGQLPTGFNRLELPTMVLAEIPPPSRTPFDVSSFAGVGVENATAWGTAVAGPVSVAPRADSVYTADLLEERPVRLGGQAPVYPPVLQSARIEGRVDVEIVVDTAGRVEPGSPRVLRSTNRLFDGPALDASATWVFRPARIGGHPVRARVWAPVTFQM